MKRIYLCFLFAMLFCVEGMAQTNNEAQAAEYYFRNKEYGKAAELYERFYEKSQNNFYYQQLLTSYLELEKYKDAQRLVEKRMKKESNNLNSLINKATAITTKVKY